MPQFDVALHHIAAQIDVAILQAHLFVRQNGFAGKKRRLLRFIQDAKLVGNQFDFAGGNVFVDGVGIALLDTANHGDDVLVAQGFGLLMARLDSAPC